MAVTRADLLRYVVDTYFVLRTAIYVIAFALPTAIIVWTAVDPGLTLQESLSGYYYTPARTVFVGALAAVGVLLVVYRGYSTGENRLLDVAGLFAVAVAVFPTARSGGCNGNAICIVHQVSAAGFFLTVALAILLYSATTLSLSDSRSRMAYRAAYLVLSGALVAGVVVYAIFRTDIALFYFETAGIYAFGLYWLIKTVELYRSDFDRQMMDAG